METTHLYDIARNAGEILLNPVAVIISLTLVLALVTGVAGRLATFAEERRHPVAVVKR